MPPNAYFHPLIAKAHHNGARVLGKPEDLLGNWDLLTSFRWNDTLCIE
jgi:hypothetical protein